MTTKHMACDLVVLGAGGSGLVAAVKASEDGVKKVIVFEKAKKPGGATWFAGGPGVGGGGPMAGPPGGMGGDTGGQDDGPGTGGAGGSGGGDSQDISSRFSEWFTTKVGPENMVSTPRMEKYKDLPDPSIGPGRGGTFVITKMIEFCQKQGIQVLYETPARRFVTNAEGKVTGVLADTRDGQLQVDFKACVIASGGFGRNMEKLKKYWPEEYNNKELFFLCPPGMMGDGIDMAEAVGAYIDPTKWSQDVAGGFFLNYPIHHPYSWALMMMMDDKRFVSINLNGRRWYNEAGPKVSLAGQPRAAAYSIADDDLVEMAGSDLVNGKGPIGTGIGSMMVMGEMAPESDEARALERWREDLEYEAAIDEQGAGGNHVKKANTLVELALKMDIDPATFVETMERYNQFCEAGKDLDFNKDADCLKPIRKPPFYAIYGHRFSQCTKGLNGIAVNTDFEVLNPKGEAMPGLYAAGDTCTIYGGLVLQMSARGIQSESGVVAVDGNVLSTTPSPCGGSMAAFASGFSAGTNVGNYILKGRR